MCLNHLELVSLVWGGSRSNLHEPHHHGDQGVKGTRAGRLLKARDQQGCFHTSLLCGTFSLSLSLSLALSLLLPIALSLSLARTLSLSYALSPDAA